MLALLRPWILPATILFYLVFFSLQPPAGSLIGPPCLTCSLFCTNQRKGYKSKAPAFFLFICRLFLQSATTVCIGRLTVICVTSRSDCLDLCSYRCVCTVGLCLLFQFCLALLLPKTNKPLPSLTVAINRLIILLLLSPQVVKTLSGGQGRGGLFSVP